MRSLSVLAFALFFTTTTHASISEYMGGNLSVPNFFGTLTINSNVSPSLYSLDATCDYIPVSTTGSAKEVSPGVYVLQETGSSQVWVFNSNTGFSDAPASCDSFAFPWGWEKI